MNSENSTENIYTARVKQNQWEAATYYRELNSVLRDKLQRDGQQGGERGLRAGWGWGYMCTYA